MLEKNDYNYTINKCMVTSAIAEWRDRSIDMRYKRRG